MRNALNTNEAKGISIFLLCIFLISISLYIGYKIGYKYVKWELDCRKKKEEEERNKVTPQRQLDAHLKNIRRLEDYIEYYNDDRNFRYKHYIYNTGGHRPQYTDMFDWGDVTREVSRIVDKMVTTEYKLYEIKKDWNMEEDKKNELIYQNLTNTLNFMKRDDLYVSEDELEYVNKFIKLKTNKISIHLYTPEPLETTYNNLKNKPYPNDNESIQIEYEKIVRGYDLKNIKNKLYWRHGECEYPKFADDKCAFQVVKVKRFIPYKDLQKELKISHSKHYQHMTKERIYKEIKKERAK